MFAYPSDIDISSERLVSFGLNNISDDIWRTSNDYNYVLSD